MANMNLWIYCRDLFDGDRSLFDNRIIHCGFKRLLHFSKPENREIQPLSLYDLIFEKSANSIQFEVFTFECPVPRLFQMAALGGKALVVASFLH